MSRSMYADTVDLARPVRRTISLPYRGPWSRMILNILPAVVETLTGSSSSSSVMVARLSSVRRSETRRT